MRLTALQKEQTIQSVSNWLLGNRLGTIDLILAEIRDQLEVNGIAPLRDEGHNQFDAARAKGFKTFGKRTGRIITPVVLLFLCMVAEASDIYQQVPCGIILTEHFKLREFKCHHCKKSVVSKNLLSKLELLRKELRRPIHITSGFRCETHNKKVGGAKHSQHVKGKAADITVSGYTPTEVARAAKKVGFNFVKIYPTWTHVDVRST